MNTANRENSNELYHLTGWGNRAGDIGIDHWHHDPHYERVMGLCPAYELGFLLRVLQPADEGQSPLELRYGNGVWSARSYNQRQDADTPEDAACRLVIALIHRRSLAVEDGVKGVF